MAADEDATQILPAIAPDSTQTLPAVPAEPPTPAPTSPARTDVPAGREKPAPVGWRKRVPQGRRLIAAVVALAVVVVAVVVGAFALGGGGDQPPALPVAAPRSAGTPAADLLARAAAALAVPTGTIVQTTITVANGESTPGGRSTVWLDPGKHLQRTDAFGPAGQLSTSKLTSPTSSGLTVLVVNYPARTWSKSTVSTKSGTAPALPAGGYIDPADLRAALTSGTISYLGEEPIGARRTAHLRITGLPGDAAAATSLDLWLDLDGYLPVRSTESTARTGYVANYSWLPPGPASQAKLTLTTPSGYRKVADAAAPVANAGG